MEPIWLAHYPQGVPAQIDPARYASLAALFEESFKTFRDRKAFASFGETMTFGEVDHHSRDIAAWLQACNLPQGARIAIMMPNVLAYPAIIAAVLRAGYVMVNINPLYTARELAFQLQDCGAEAIFVLENFAATVEAARRDAVLQSGALKHVIIVRMGDLLSPLKGIAINFVVRYLKRLVPSYHLPDAVYFTRLLKAAAYLPLKPVAIKPDDIACLQYTGGTTGVAKGATLLHRNLIANALQIEEWLKPALSEEQRRAQMVIGTALPLYHIFALTTCFILGMRVGALCVLIPNPRDLPDLIRQFAKNPVQFFPAVNTLFSALLNHKDFAKANWSRLGIAVGGGMAVQRVVAENWIKATGVPVIEGYGLSETSPVLTCTPAGALQWTGTIGLPLPSTDLSIRDENDHELPLGHAGEICARGPQVMSGYWNKPAETAKAMTHDGFFRTGDIGIMDDNGYVRIVDRKKDMISVSGFKVYPNEVEDVISRIKGVREVAVIGVPDERTGEAVMALVVKSDQALSADDIKQFCHQELTPYKVPRLIVFKTELPKSNVGKILRRELRDEVNNNGGAAKLVAAGMAAVQTAIAPKDVISFWRAAGPDKWFTKDESFDAEIRSRFLPLYEEAAQGHKQDWTATDEGLLALIITLDQFPRNMFRNDARAFATDGLARDIAHLAIGRGADQRVDSALRQFIYLPFMHSEQLEDQDRCVTLFSALGNDAANNIKYAEIHRDIIRRFGRFPHRNTALGRHTTADEQAFLDGGGFAG